MPLTLIHAPLEDIQGHSSGIEGPQERILRLDNLTGHLEDILRLQNVGLRIQVAIGLDEQVSHQLPTALFGSLVQQAPVVDQLLCGDHGSKAAEQLNLLDRLVAPKVGRVGGDVAFARCFREKCLRTLEKTTEINKRPRVQCVIF